MDKKMLERVERVEAGLREIAERQRVLDEDREKVLAWDEDYQGYLEQYEAYYEDEPLSIRQYYELMARLEEINRAFNVPGADMDECFRIYGSELQFLERVLAWRRMWQRMWSDG